MLVPLLLAAIAVPEVHATVETDPVPHRGDAADDVCIWVHPKDPSLSTVIGTDKKGGLAVYDLSGRQLQYLANGATNNVDLRYGFPLDGAPVDIVAATDRDENAIDFYRVDVGSRALVSIGSVKIDDVAHGTCLYRSAASGKLYVFNANKAGQVEQWEVLDAGGGKVECRRARRLLLGGKAEGCVADDERGELFVAEERKGIWKVSAEPDAADKPRLVDDVANGHLDPDVEGLALYPMPGGSGYLIASSQGNSSFAVYERGGSNRYLASFKIAGDREHDGAEDTDGVDVSGAAMGAAFPRGMLVAQNGDNDDGNQDFLMVPWDAVARACHLEAIAGVDPRIPTREWLAQGGPPELAASGAADPQRAGEVTTAGAESGRAPR